jgi:hypothetical protein
VSTNAKSSDPNKTSNTVSVSFFEVAGQAEGDESEPLPRRRRWRGDDTDTLGVPVAITEILARTDEVAVMVSGFFAFPVGFIFSLITLSRLDPPSSDINPMGGPRGLGRRRPPGQGLLFGIGFADGSKVTNLEFPGRRPGSPHDDEA